MKWTPQHVLVWKMMHVCVPLKVYTRDVLSFMSVTSFYQTSLVTELQTNNSTASILT